MVRRRTNSGTARAPEPAPLKFDQKLVLNQWMLSLFGKDTFEQLAEPLKLADLEGLNEDNNHKFLAILRALWEWEALPADVLLGYDQNIVKHTLTLNEHRAEPIRWKYFQWLTLLFSEVYLDRFFRDPDKLLADLNAHVEKFNAGKLDRDKVPPYEPTSRPVVGYSRVIRVRKPPGSISAWTASRTASVYSASMKT